MEQPCPLNANAPAARPWYRQRWPWLLMLGPAVVVVAGTYTGYLAFTRQDAMVVDDYYNQGKAINQDLRRDRVASALALSFNARYDAVSGTLSGGLRSAGMPLGLGYHIYLAHATQPHKDRALTVQPDAAGDFSVALPALEAGRWQVVVEGAQRDWRLSRVWQSPQQSALTIVADGAAPAVPSDSGAAQAAGH
jgi:hypothetical protein